MTLHTDRFTGKVAEYAQYRERYRPDIVLPILRKHCGLTPQWRVADIGAGTGMAGDVFRANGNSVIAIEPNEEMRLFCAASHSADQQFTVIEGSAESTGLPEASIDIVVVGRALHWFDRDKSFREFRRILQPQGWVVILACGRAEDGRDENVVFKELMQNHTGRDQFRGPLLNVYRELETLFAGGRFIHFEAAGEMRLTWEELGGLTLSLSHTPMPGSAAFPIFESELRNYFERFQQQEKIVLATRTYLNAGKFGNETHE